MLLEPLKTNELVPAQAILASPYGVIDIGSNSVRLVVYTSLTRSAIPLFNEKVLCGLGAGLSSSGKLSPDGVLRALNLLKRFAMILKQLQVKKFTIIATAAARDAKNGPDFISQVEAIFDQKIDLLSGEREAELAALGVISGGNHVAGIAGDLGGGSLELMNIETTGLKDAVTLPLGVLVLDDLAKKDLKKANHRILKYLKKAKWLSKGKGRPLYIVGGSWRSIIKMYMVEIDYPLNVLHGFEVPTKTLAAYLQKILQTSDIQSLKGIHKVSKARVPVIIYAALLLLRLLEEMKPSKVITSQCGVREGVHFEALPEPEKKKDPLLVAAFELARLQARDARHALELCRWTDRLFENKKLKETDDLRRLRHVACLLSDVGWRTRSTFRAGLTMDAIAHGAYNGIDHSGRSFLALSNFLRHKNSKSNDYHKGWGEIAGDDLLFRARVIGAAIRTAHMISVGAPGIISENPIYIEDGHLILILRKPYADLAGERLDSRFTLLASLLELAPILKIKS